MNLRQNKVYPRTLCEILEEDYKRSLGLTMNEIKKKYEGWILYFITKGNLAVIKCLAHDLSQVSGLNKDEIVRLFRTLKSQISIDLDLSVEFNEQFEPYIVVNNKLRPKIECTEEIQIESIDKSCKDQSNYKDPIITHKNSNLRYENYSIPIENITNACENPNYLSNNTDSNISQLKPIENSKTLSYQKELQNSFLPHSQPVIIPQFEVNHIIEEFFLSYQSPFVTPYSKLPESPPIPSCQCKCSCSNHTFCSCSQFILSEIGTQKPLLVIKNTKRLPRRWNNEYFIFECQKSCKCNKLLCNLTFFVPGYNYPAKLEIVKGESIATKRLLRGEFVMEVTGELNSSPFEKGIQLGQGIYKDLKLSNVKNVNEDKVGNLVAVRVFGYEKKRIVCRLVLFTTKVIEKGDILCLNHSELERLMDN